MKIIKMTPESKNLNKKEYDTLFYVLKKMREGGVSNIPETDIDKLFEREDSYLVVDYDENENFLGLFAIQIYDDEDDGKDCYVNIAYSEKRMSGIFKGLLEYTEKILPKEINENYGTISFGVYTRNDIMRTVMDRVGCAEDKYAFFLDDAILYRKEIKKEEIINE